MPNSEYFETLAEAKMNELKTMEECKREVSRLNIQLQQTKIRQLELEEEIAEMRSSLIWTLVMKYHFGIVERFLPFGSKGRDIYEMLLSGVRGQFKEKERNLLPDELPAQEKQEVSILPNTPGEDYDRFLKKYGNGFVPYIDERDEMFQFLVNHPAVKDPVIEYYLSGEVMMSSLERILRDMGTGFDQIRSFLDFACGYGRFERFLVTRCGIEKITVSDIDRNAVDFCRKVFKVNGFYSVGNPLALNHSRKYDVILVASLFSHLYLPLWEDWFRKLYSMLEEGGLLILSTHGVHCYNLVDSETKKRIEVIRDGFYYLRQSETKRLPINEYGTTYVDRKFVENFALKNNLGKIMAFYPKELWSYQDVYVIKKV